ncbi:MAG TPA: VCBS repeat-containing protein, partial [Pyrinomonadaceae bacterium]|nr:VCBS repeat-containing protein [Pyrinomonadaceae bacterium]
MRIGACAAALLSALSVASYGVTLGSDKYSSRTNATTHTESAMTGNRFFRGGMTSADFLRQNSVSGTAPLSTPFGSLARVDSPQGVVDAPVDFNGDGRTDYVVTRNTGGTPGQLVWYYALNGAAGTGAVSWGLSTDWVLSEDFDGDGKDDIVIWRPAPAGQAAFYILLSATSTARIVPFGEQGNTPAVTADYDGDGKADPAVYRP